MFFVALIYAANFSIAKYVMVGGYIEPSAFIICRVIAALILFFLYHRLLLKEKILKEDRRALFWCGMFGVAINQLMFFKGLKYTTPVHAALIMTTTPIIVLIVENIISKTRITPYKLAGILVAFFGAVMIILHGKKIEFDNRQLIGDLFVFINAVSYSIYLVKIKPFTIKYHPITINRLTFFYGALLVIPFGITDLVHTDWISFTNQTWWAFGYVLLFTTFFAYYFNSWAMVIVNPSLVGVYIYLQPLLTSIIALILGTDSLDLHIILSGICIFLGVFLVSYQKIPKKV